MPVWVHRQPYHRPLHIPAPPGISHVRAPVPLPPRYKFPERQTLVSRGEEARWAWPLLRPLFLGFYHRRAPPFPGLANNPTAAIITRLP